MNLDTDYTLVIFLTLFGFCLLAFLLLWPVHRFLKREEKVSQRWAPTDAMPTDVRDPHAARWASAPPSPPEPADEDERAS
ncbi:MAG: hypothetical protein AAGI71_17205 [Bacteroidota bacterium]